MIETVCVVLAVYFLAHLCLVDPLWPPPSSTTPPLRGVVLCYLAVVLPLLPFVTTLDAAAAIAFALLQASIAVFRFSRDAPPLRPQRPPPPLCALFWRLDVVVVALAALASAAQASSLPSIVRLYSVLAALFMVIVPFAVSLHAHVSRSDPSSFYLCRLFTTAVRRETRHVRSSFSSTRIPPRFSDASALSLLFFNWLSPLVAQGRDRPLQTEDLAEMRAAFAARHAAYDHDKGLAPQWAAELSRRPGRQPSLLRALAHAFGRRFVVAGVVRLCNDAAVFVPPVLLGALTRFLQERDAAAAAGRGSGSDARGVAMAVAMLAAYVAQSLTFHHYMALNMAVQAHIRGALVATVFRKSCSLGPLARAAYSAGQIQNLMSSDTRAVADIVVYLHTLWSPVLQVGVALCLLVSLLGWLPTLSGLVCIVATIPVQARLADLLKNLRALSARQTDERVKVLSEALGGIKLVKLYAWEMSFVRRLLRLRGAELRLTRASLLGQACAALLSNGLPTLLSVVVFAVFATAGARELDAATVFPAIALFAVIRPGLSLFPRTLANLARTLASLARLQDFLLADELQALCDGPHAIDQDELRRKRLDAAIDHASFAWNPAAAAGPTLRGVCLQIARGELVAVVGPTGAGKSTLLSALLGEVPILCGRAGTRAGASVALCAQVPFIRNGSVRANVLFGRTLEREHYRATLRACCLEPDLAALPAGDGTEIGARGINLSGGQRARVSLARAVYARADIVLLDDPLSAVDAHVGKRIFQQCVVGMLAGRTRVLVTNQIHHAASASVDSVVVVKDGCVVESGRRAALMADPLSELSKLLESSGQLPDHVDDPMVTPAPEITPSENVLVSTPDEIELDGTDAAEAQESTEKSPLGKLGSSYGAMEAGRLTQKEKKSEGKVMWKHYRLYLQAMGLWRFVLPTVLSLLLAEAASLSVNIWLAGWSEASQAGSGDAISVRHRLIVFMLLGASTFVFMSASGFLSAFGSLRASVSIHEKLLLSVLGSTSAFFNATPQGRLVNRFNADIDKIDVQLAPTFASLARTAMQLTSAIALNVWAAPHLIVLVLPIAACCIYLQDYQRRTVVDLYRLEALARSPLYSHFAETLDGVMTIRAYKGVERAAHTSDCYTDALVRTTYTTLLVKRWMAVRLDALCTAFIFSATLSAVIAPRGGVSASTLGLALSYTMQLIITLAFVVRYFTEVESNMNAMERMVEYSEPPFPQEEADGLEGLMRLKKVPGPALDARESRGVISSEKIQLLNQVERDETAWPRRGKISFEDVVMRYKPSLPPALRGVSFTAMPGEHIGIVGRTGAGKSSAIQSLFRLYEPSSGRVLIDGDDIATKRLFDLRSALGVIPQEAVCFSGTVRSNLDLFSERDDAAVRRALDLCGLQDTMREQVDLDFEIGENGGNLSVGQRQLLCLGRALLKGSQVLVLDEATSSVSDAVDEKIQQVLRAEMSQCTILTVAHRLHTVIQCDRVIVMENGRIAETGKPAELLSRPSMFANLVDETGPSTAANLRRLANSFETTVNDS